MSTRHWFTSRAKSGSRWRIFMSERCSCSTTKAASCGSISRPTPKTRQPREMDECLRTATCTPRSISIGRPSSRTHLLRNPSRRLFSLAGQSWCPATASLSSQARSQTKSRIKCPTKCKSGTWRTTRWDVARRSRKLARVLLATTTNDLFMLWVEIWRTVNPRIKFASSIFTKENGPKCLQCANIGQTPAPWSSVTISTPLVASKPNHMAKLASTLSRGFICTNREPSGKCNRSATTRLIWVKSLASICRISLTICAKILTNQTPPSSK